MLDRAAATDEALVQQHNRIVQATIRVARQANAHAVVAALVAELQSPYAEVRRWAARTLEALGPDAHDAIEALEALLADSDASVQQAAQAALRAIRD
jgi:Holliday junction resolvasome RuvABC DNA-binding subunit